MEPGWVADWRSLREWKGKKRGEGGKEGGREGKVACSHECMIGGRRGGKAE